MKYLLSRCGDAVGRDIHGDSRRFTHEKLQKLSFLKPAASQVPDEASIQKEPLQIFRETIKDNPHL